MYVFIICNAQISKGDFDLDTCFQFFYHSKPLKPILSNLFCSLRELVQLLNYWLNGGVKIVYKQNNAICNQGYDVAMLLNFHRRSCGLSNGLC